MHDANPQTYNGWINRETWATALWLTNDQGTYETVLDLLAGCDTQYEATQRLQAFITDEAYPLETASLYSDLLNSALARVEWRDVVAHVWEDVEGRHAA